MNKTKAEPVRPIAAYDTDGAAKQTKKVSSTTVKGVKPPQRPTHLTAAMTPKYPNLEDDSSRDDDASPLPGGHGKRHN